MNIREQLEKYQPFNEQEQRDKENMIKFIDTFEDVLTRENAFGHFTSSAWAVNKERTKILMIYHNIYKSWAWTGGHADGEDDLLGVAIRELKEETGIENVKVVDDNMLSIEIITVDGVRIEYLDGFALVRKSNTSPCLTVRFEGSTKEQMEKYRKEIIDLINSEIN